MKIYTKTGDSGTTSLFGGERVPKYHPRIEACGSIDELNAHLGMVARRAPNQFLQIIQTIQRDLFIIGSNLATRNTSATLPTLRQDTVAWLEQRIDEYNAQLPELHTFILPGGSLAGATCHVARTICRRAERRVVELHNIESINPVFIKYLNRLSDFLFQLARVMNQADHQPELLWK